MREAWNYERPTEKLPGGCFSSRLRQKPRRACQNKHELALQRHQERASIVRDKLYAAVAHELGVLAFFLAARSEHFRYDRHLI